MAGKIATRAAYGEALVELAEQYPELVVFDADLSNATMTKGFAAKYPERFFDMGIAECNMTGVAAGMSTCGFKPFTNTFAIFASGRAWEQVRNSIGYPHLNVKVVGSHGGLSVGEDGATHQCTEDLALMRVIPGMKVLCPCDGYEMKLAVKALLEYDGPAYLRLGRAAVETVTDEIEGYRFELDKGVTLKDGKDVTVIATGLMVQMALKAREMMAAEGISVRVIDMHTIKPLDGELVRKAALETGCIVTSEEHSIIGGLGGAVAEFLSENCPTPLVRHGVNDAFGRSGTEGLPAIAAFAAACRAALPKRTESIARQRRLLAQAQELLRAIDGVQLLGAQEAPHILNLAVPGVRSQGLINALQERDIYVSAGSACSKGHRSHVLEAMGVDAAWIDGSVRVSLSDETTEDDIRALAEALPAVLTELRGGGRRA